MGGTILKLVGSGKSVSVLDMTRGEMATSGSLEQRAGEAAKAAAALGLAERRNLGMPDTGLREGDEAVRPVVRAIRACRPALLFAPLWRDMHPDHAATAIIASRAFFLSGLARWDPESGPPHRPGALLRYAGDLAESPGFLVDISEFADAKAAVLRCFSSQVAPPDRSHLLTGLDIVERAEARDRFYGAMAGCRAAEPFWSDRPLVLGDLAPLMS